MVEYLQQAIEEVMQTPRPRYGMAADGYTHRSGAPTRYMIRLSGETRWRRLMVWCFSNCGTLFVRVLGKELVVRGGELPWPSSSKSSGQM